MKLLSLIHTAKLVSLGIIAGASFGMTALMTNAQAQTAGEAVAATINDKMISTFDVRQRVRLMVLMSGNRIPESAFPQLQEQALRDLVEENLKLQEAARLEFEVSDAEVDEEIERIATGSNMTTADLVGELESQGIAIDTVRSQIRSRITWQNLVSGRYRSRVRVTDQQVDAVYERLRQDSRREQYLVSEICLPVEDESRVQEIYRAGLQMIDQMRKGVPFDAVAKQFSVCPTAANGGDLGWIRSGELAPELDNVLQNLQVGAVSIPVPYEGALHIMAVRQKRDASEGGERSYQLVYAGAPMSVGEQKARETFAKLPLTNACEGRDLAVDLGQGFGVTTLPPVPESKITAAFKPALANLPRGQVSDLIVSDGAYHAVMMCEEDEGLGLPSRAQIEDRLFTEQLNLLSRRYLRDVERNSAVDIRLEIPPEQAG